MRSAESRLGLLESVNSAWGGMSHTWDRLRVPRRYVYAGLLAGGGMLGSWALRRLFSGRRATAVPAAAPAAGSSSAVYVLVQLLSVLLLPWLRQHVSGAEWGGFIQRWSPSHILFRWLGLEK